MKEYIRELSDHEIELVAGGTDVFGDGGSGVETVTVTAPSLNQGTNLITLGLELVGAGVIVVSIAAVSAPVAAAAGVVLGAQLLIEGGLFVTGAGMMLIPATPK
jgi:hypothetical protein